MSEQRQKPLLALIQEVRTRIQTETQRPDQYHMREQSVISLLQLCGKNIARSLPGQDMQEIRGHDAAKRALEVAAAGAHHVLLIGPPGAWRHTLAREHCTFSTLSA